MNLRERFNLITEKLTPFAGIWENEILMQYPHPFDYYRQDWLEFLEQAPEDVLLQLEMKNFDHPSIPESLRAHGNEFNNLCKLALFHKEEKNTFDAFTFLHIKPKKQYEIETLAPEVDKMMKENQLKTVVDIGGGIGKIAQAITNHYFHPVTSIDMDPALQKTGIERNRKNQKKNAPLVHYINSKLELGNPHLASLFTPESLSLGLHTCGDLANTHFDLAIKGQAGALINLGCCYYKISKNETYNISTHAKNSPHLSLNLYALSLATNAHRQVGDWHFQYKNMVKNYRYAFHIYLYEVIGIKEFQSLGSSHKKHYHGDFSSYAFEQMKRLNLECPDSEESLNYFFHDKDRSRMIKKMILSGILRGIYGRSLEMYLLLDRAIYLEENGFKTELIEYFDEVVSPRNIGIRAIRN